MASATGELPLDRPTRARLGRDDWTLRVLIGLVALYLVATLALPLYAILSKSATVYDFRFDEIAIEQADGASWQNLGLAADWVDQLAEPVNRGLTPTSRTRLPARDIFPKDQFAEGALLRVHDRSANGGLLLYEGALSAPGGQFEIEAGNLRKLLIRPTGDVGLRNYVAYFTTPALRRSIGNSLMIAAVTTVITVSLAFLFAFALTRSCMPAKGLFKMIAMVPILVPSLLPGIALVYLFGKQGMLKELLFGGSIYGPIGIVTASVFYSLPHALVIILVALSLADARLYEAATALRASPRRTFFTVTLPGARYGLISAAFVVFNLVITDFGVPKVIGGQYDVLALDIYKQVVGQQNFEMGAVVSVVLLIPAVVAFAVDRLMQRRQVALLSARAVPYEPKPSRRFDLAMLAVCILISIFILGLLATCQFAALVTFWPYDLSLSLKNYNFDVVDGGGWESYLNSIQMAFLVALIGTAIVFVGAYLVEKARGFDVGRTAVQFLAMMPMAIPGMVLGLAYVFFFNDPANPLHALYGTMAILVICTIAHFYTVAHLTATTALKQMDPEFEAVSASLKQPVTRMFRTVTVPVCLPAILDIGIYLFVNAMTTVSAVVFLYAPDTTLAAVAVLNMDDAGDIAPAAAMGMMIFYTNVAARLLHTGASAGLLRRTQAWRRRGA
ncbi:MAG: putative 2-aminoethylphosphonate ABC transporter permease subunit [Rhizobiales bacterium]|nr:putative 2-aminoethylphosphonate ABC transporter permease subunit [Hyphomicrobiales bacterium]